MYEIHCETCGRIGFHPSRAGAECRAETHRNSQPESASHDCGIRPMQR